MAAAETAAAAAMAGRGRGRTVAGKVKIGNRKEGFLGLLNGLLKLGLQIPFVCMHVWTLSH